MTCEQEIVISEREGLGGWKLVYRADCVEVPGFYFSDRGNPEIRTPASKESIFHALRKLVAAQAEDLIDANC